MKVSVSSDWLPEERSALVNIIREELTGIQQQDKEARKTCKWEAPFLQQYKRQMFSLENLIFYAENAEAQFLELNRRNFSEYLYGEEYTL